MSAARTERLLNLLTLLLNSRRAISLREIRELEEFGAYRTADPKSGERAFERDKAALVDLGVPLRWVAPEDEEDEEGIGGYVIDRDKYYLPELAFQPAELALLSIAGAAAAAIPGFPGRAAVIRALAKIGFDADESSAAPAMVHAPVQAGDPTRVANILQTLHDAVAKRLRIKLSYERVDGEPTEREVDPWGLYYRQGIWYLVAYCHLREAERTFHLGRMNDVSVMGNKRGPHFDVPAKFSISEHVQRRPWEFPSQQAVDVVIKLAPRLVPAIPEIFGSRADVERSGDDVRVKLRVTHPDALVEAVLPFGSSAVVEEPADIRNRIAGIYRDLAGSYASRGKEGAA